MALRRYVFRQPLQVNWTTCGTQLAAYKIMIIAIKYTVVYTWFFVILTTFYKTRLFNKVSCSAEIGIFVK